LLLRLKLVLHRVNLGGQSVGAAIRSCGVLVSLRSLGRLSPIVGFPLVLSPVIRIIHAPIRPIVGQPIRLHGLLLAFLLLYTGQPGEELRGSCPHAVSQRVFFHGQILSRVIVSPEDDIGPGRVLPGALGRCPQPPHRQGRGSPQREQQTPNVIQIAKPEKTYRHPGRKSNDEETEEHTEDKTYLR